MRIARLLTVCAAGLTLLGVAAPAFAAASQPGIGVAPAHRQPGGVQYFVETTRAGTVFTDQAILANPGTQPVRVLLYPADGLTARTTGAVFADRSDRLRGAGAWLSVPTASMMLPANSRQLVSFTVHVPAGASPGDHLAGLAVENAAVTSRAAGALTVRTVNRSVIGVLIRVAGATTTAMRVSGVRIASLAGFGTASLNVEMANTGSRLVKPHLQVILRGPAGYRRSLTRQLDTVLPGDSLNFPQPWADKLPAGLYQVSVVLTAPGMIPATYSTHLSLGAVLPGSHPGEHPATRAATGRRLPSPLVIGGIALLAALLAGGLAGQRRRRRGSPSRGRHASGGRGQHASAGTVLFHR